MRNSTKERIDGRKPSTEERARDESAATRPASDKDRAGSEDGRGEPTEKIGLVIDDRYRITGLMGRGGMGSVYKAEHMGIHRTVALKLLHPTLANVPEVSKRFEREAFAVGRIEHPNCVDVSDFGKLQDGSLYLVMEYLQGRSVGDVLATEKRFEPFRALHIMRHVLRGLGHAHAKDIVHRDIKPENVFLVDQDGDPDFAKILDFGIAKLVGTAEATAGEVKLTQAGVAFGTPVYMSPEQCVGNPIDGRADLYAASVVLYEMITGKPPFYSDDKLEVLSMHATREVPTISSVAPQVAVPPQVEAVVRRGLAKRPGERYANAAEYIAAIDHVLATCTPYSGVPYPRASSEVSVPVLPGAHTTSPTPIAHGTTTPTGVHTGHYPTQAPRKGRVAGVLILIGMIVAAGVIAAILVAGSADKGAEGTPAEQAAAKLEAGKPKAAIKLLERKAEKIAEDAPAQLLLGHAYSATSRYRDAVRAYERALTLKPDLLASEEELRANLKVMLDTKDGDVALDAADILISGLSEEHLSTKEDAKAKLVELASKGRKMDDRKRARELAEKHGVSDKVDFVTSYAKDLQQGERCKERHEAVARLRALGDERAIKPLKKARWRSGRGSYRNKNINACLKDDAVEAIKYLENLGQETEGGDESEEEEKDP